MRNDAHRPGVQREYAKCGGAGSAARLDGIVFVKGHSLTVSVLHNADLSNHTDIWFNFPTTKTFWSYDCKQSQAPKLAKSVQFF